MSWSGSDREKDDRTRDNKMGEVLFYFPEEGIGEKRKHGEPMVVEEPSLEDIDI